MAWHGAALARARRADVLRLASQAWVRLIDAHYALGQYRQAADMVAEATARCAGFKQAPEYKVGGQAGVLGGWGTGWQAGWGAGTQTHKQADAAISRQQRAVAHCMVLHCMLVGSAVQCSACLHAHAAAFAPPQAPASEPSSCLLLVDVQQIPVNAVMPQAIEAAVTKAVGKSSKVAA